MVTMPWRRPYRFWRHVATDSAAVRRAFPPDALVRIEQAISAGERMHRAQLCVAIEGALPAARVMRKLPPRERALEVFGVQRAWDTEENCGVLLYLLLADRDVEIIADRGIHRQVGDAAWQAVCERMESALRTGRFADGVVAGIEEITALLARHFPRTQAGGNELPDRPVIL
jgi:uncharacterized membrane protein